RASGRQADHPRIETASALPHIPARKEVRDERRRAMSDTTIEAEGGERHGFGAEVGRLLDLVVHSLYSDREIFLRELVANAADAIDRRRFESLTDTRLAPPGEAKVRIVPNKPARTLLIADSGIGMTKPELVQNLGT